MGCCLSAGKVTAPPVSAAKTPPPIEEETVKEVVVQSVSVSVPVPVPEPDPIPVAEIVPSAPEPRNPPPSLPSPEISHNKSDTCSVSHSFSTATTATAASILEDDAVSKPHRHPPPPSSTSRRNMSERISRSPGGRHSPQGKLRSRPVRERQQPLQQNPTHNPRNVVSGPLPRSGLQEGGPRRRSRSPATRAPSSSRRSPMKKREAAAPEKDGAEEVKVNKEEEKVAVEEKKEEDVVAVKDPEVSMECFIFL